MDIINTIQGNKHWIQQSPLYKTLTMEISRILCVHCESREDGTCIRDLDHVSDLQSLIVLSLARAPDAIMFSVG